MTEAEILDKNYLLECDLPLWRAVELAAWRYACLNSFPLKSVEPVRNLRGDNDGLCYAEEGRIAVRIRVLLSNGVWSSCPENGIDIVDTLAHELAHLDKKQGYENHGRRWKLEFDELKEQMLEDGLDAEFDRLRV